ncbi:2-nitropropane dioxygenase [Bacillaceae bacterium JMAK1]|nr:2-nitropropane dioxygenase [Bacillaceae bacterium JMAK1]
MNRFCERFGVEVPIVQGGLAYLAYAELAAAVSNAGGLGQITATSLGDAESLRAEIKKIKQLTKKPYAINFSLGRGSVDELLDVVIEEEVPAISVTAGNPTSVFERVKHTNIKKLVLVAAVRQAQKAEQLGADAIIVVGQEGGGHLGRDDVGTFVLVPRVVDSVSIPVLASGGIVDGRGYAAALALGADGIEMGTRFIATQECIAHSAYKEAILSATEADTIVIKRTIERPARALRTKATDRIKELEDEGAEFNALQPYISGASNLKLIEKGDHEQGFGWAGQGVGLIQDIPTVQELIETMQADCKQALTGDRPPAR